MSETEPGGRHPGPMLAELHTHVGAAVDPALLFTIAHDQGIKLPCKNYWDFAAPGLHWDWETTHRGERAYIPFLSQQLQVHNTPLLAHMILADFRATRDRTGAATAPHSAWKSFGFQF